MPPHPSFNIEKSPVDRWDYEGLQLDTRARENQDKHLDSSKPQGFLPDDFDDHGNYLNEKQAHGEPTFQSAPQSPDSGFSGPSPITPIKGIDEKLGHAPPPPPERRLCGLRRKAFWLLFGLTLALILAAAIIGGVVGGLQARRSGRTPPQASNAANSSSQPPSFAPLQSADVMVGSPLNAITYEEGSGQNVQDRQVFRVYYQSALGDVKEVVSEGLAAWGSATPLLTDAVNHTGLAALTYMNGTNRQGNLFYVGMNGYLQEKRKIFSNTEYWLPGTLNNLNLPVVGNISQALQSGDPKNDWDGYRMTAVYSTKFHSGPGVRLFYHASQLNGSNFVQELVWDQKNDTWAKGAVLSRPYPNSHLAVTVDESTNILRLFYSSGNKTLSESWIDISDPDGTYNTGLEFDGLLYNNAADIAAISVNGTTYVYRYSSTDQTPQAGIHELSITGVPNSVNNQETYNLSSPFVSGPVLTANNNTSLYQPLAASNTVVPGLAPEVFVFWAEKPTGDPTANITGFGGLSEISRPMANTSWPSGGQLVIPLGSDNSKTF